VVLYEANREYVAEVLTRIQRSIAELNIPHEALHSATERGRNQVVVMEAEYHTLRTGRFEKRRGQRAV
jgi:hypothetical protein